MASKLNSVSPAEVTSADKVGSADPVQDGSPAELEMQEIKPPPKVKAGKEPYKFV